MKYGVFLSGDDTFTLSADAAQTGTHTVTAHVFGGVATSTFEGVEGDPLELPNIFPEYGQYVVSITQPDGTLFDDGSACEIVIEIAPSCPSLG